VFWYWFAAIPALALSFAGLAAQVRRSRYIRRELARRTSWTPPATLIVPVKGEDEGLRENLAALATLDYPDYELIVAARCAADIPSGVLPAHVKVVLGGEDGPAGEKVQNLRAAVSVARKRSVIFAFADSDGRPERGWLRALAAPLEDHAVGAATGYRWFTPAPATFWSLIASVWNSAACGLLGPGDNAFAWGGAMAVRRETFFQARVLDYWKETVSDDYALSAAIHAARLSIAYAPGALTPSFDRHRCAPFFRWIRRQMIITRVYNPRLWWTGFIAHIIYCAAIAASVAACCAGYWPAAIALAAQLGCGMLLSGERARLARRALPGSTAWFQRQGWSHTLLVPIATWVWLASFVSSATSVVIEWRGRIYRLRPADPTASRP
jgi:cellulose synthase/poly-beta-1,6-N-acetylglucosamine synthase-like glycosyltransferase